jgi:hypothetical protein
VAGRRRHPGRAGAGGNDAGRPGDLEVLDPITGEAVAPSDGRGGGRGGMAGGRPRLAAARRRRRLAVGLALGSVACALAAGYFVMTIVSLRGLERTWSQAMAVDEARRRADGAVITALDEVGDADDHAAAQQALGRIGDEAAARLQRDEVDLRGRWIPDGKVDHLRDAMAEALRFRRFQLGPSRRLLGDTPLQKVEGELARQLDRFGLGRTTVDPPTLRSEADALRGLRRYVDVPTGTVVAALDDRGHLVTLDLDRSRYGERALDVEAGSLLGVADLAVVVGGGEAVAYPVGEPDAPPRWRVPADAAVVGTASGPVALWTTVGRHVGGVQRDGSPAPDLGIDLPAEGAVAGATDGGLLVRRPASLELWDPTAGRPKLTLLPFDGFLGSTATSFVFRYQGPTSALVVRPVPPVGVALSPQVQEVQLPGAAVGPAVGSPVDPSIAFAAGTRGDDLATVYVLRREEIGAPTALLGLDGPRATVRPGGLAWSPDGTLLFWVTPAGRLAYGAADGRGGATVRVLTAPLRAIVALPSGR